MQILKMTNTNMTIFGYLGSETPQSFGAQIYLYPIMQVLVMHINFSYVADNIDQEVIWDFEDWDSTQFQKQGL